MSEVSSRAEVVAEALFCLFCEAWAGQLRAPDSRLQYWDSACATCGDYASAHSFVHPHRHNSSLDTRDCARFVDAD